MKKFLILCFAAVCCILTSVAFTSCSDDDSDDYVAYIVSPKGEMSLDKTMLNLKICEKMREAIKASFGDAVVYSRDDAKAIKACDKVAEEYRNVNAGTIELYMSIPSSDPDNIPTTTVKTYTFPF